MSEHLAVAPDGYKPIYTYEDYKNIVNDIDPDTGVITGNYILMNDLNIGERNPMILPEFKGVFDFNNFEVRVNAKTEYDGYGFTLFYDANYGTIKT